MSLYNPAHLQRAYIHHPHIPYIRYLLHILSSRRPPIISIAFLISFISLRNLCYTFLMSKVCTRWWTINRIVQKQRTLQEFPVSLKILLHHIFYYNSSTNVTITSPIPQSILITPSAPGCVTFCSAPSPP